MSMMSMQLLSYSSYWPLCQTVNRSDWPSIAFGQVSRAQYNSRPMADCYIEPCHSKCARYGPANLGLQSRSQDAEEGEVKWSRAVLGHGQAVKAPI